MPRTAFNGRSFLFGFAGSSAVALAASFAGQSSAAVPVATVAASAANILVVGESLRAAGQASGGGTRAMDWELDFRPGALRLFTDTTDGKAYWYFTYHVVNRSGREHMWAPRFEFFTDKGAIHLSGREIPSRVTEAVIALLGNALLEDQNQIIGQLLIGEEHAKDGVVLWPADDSEVTEFTVFVTGASGKVRKVPDPKSGQPRVERWTLRFNYLVPGDALKRGSKPVEPTNADEDLKEGAERRTDWGVWLWR